MKSSRRMQILSGPLPAVLSLMVMTLLWLSAASGIQESGDVYPSPDPCDRITADTADECIRLNEIQVLGTHNSYKLAPAPGLIALLDREEPGWAANIEYEHRPLREQLDELGIRQLELDLFADPQGGLFAEPAGAILSGDDAFLRPEELLEPGFKVLHVQDIDYRSHCLTLSGCLREIREWSLLNPSHLPVMILLEIKESPREDRGPVSFVDPVPITESLLGEVDREIRTLFSDDHLITPDDVRGEYATLQEAVREKGWPTLGESRGRVLFALDNTNHIRELYLQEAPELSGRVMFTSSEPGEPSAGFIKMNNSIDTSETIRERVASGYLVRTRADIPTYEARSGDTSRRDAALTSGAQYVSTDYPEPSPFDSGYIVRLPGTEGPGRCNPVSAPPGCRDRFITE